MRIECQAPWYMSTCLIWSESSAGLVGEDEPMLGDPLLERLRGPTQDFLHIVSHYGRLVDGGGQHCDVGVAEFGWKANPDEPLTDEVVGNLLVLQWPTQDAGDDVN